MRSPIVALAAGCLLLASGVTHAEQRALLVGVGKYAHPGNDLPGIDLDLERMRETLIIMGFEDRQIKSLLDEESTAENVIREFKSWLTEGVGPEDRVVFYYSGHGSNIPDFDGDEEDGVDEVLVTHDARPTRINGRPTLTGVVSDDTLASMIDAINSNRILVIVDACHSGTVTRDIVMDNLSLGAEPIYTKSFTYPGMPEGEIAFSRSFGKSAGDNFVSISAAGDGEKAIGTMKGGVFTIGFTDAIRRAAQSEESITINDLRESAAAYIRQHVDQRRVHNPQVTGSAQLAAGALRVIPLADGNGPNRQRLLDIVAQQDKPFDFKASKTTYVIDEPVELSMTIPTDGYLNVVTVDSADNATVLFPNRYHADHAVKAGPFAIPTSQMTFDLPASEPTGPTLVAAFVTQEPVNFYASSTDERNADGTLNVDFSTMSHTATRAIRVAARKEKAAVYGALVELDVVPK